MAPTVESDVNVKYLLLVMKHTELPKPNYHAIDEEAGINTSANTQRRFKSLIEKAGYLLINDKVVPADATTITPKKPRVKKGNKGTTPASNKKREIQEATMNYAEEDGGVIKDAILDDVSDSGEDDQG